MDKRILYTCRMDTMKKKKRKTFLKTKSFVKSIPRTFGDNHKERPRFSRICGHPLNPGLRFSYIPYYIH